MRIRCLPRLWLAATFAAASLIAAGASVTFDEATLAGAVQRRDKQAVLSLLESGGALKRKGSQFTCDIEELSIVAGLE